MRGDRNGDLANRIRAGPRPSRTGRRVAGMVGIALAGLATAWAAGLLVFISLIPTAPADPATATDAVVVLTGGSERLQEGVRLLASGRARKLLVSGVHQEVDIGQLLANSPEAAGLSASVAICCVQLGHSADNTAGNARETATWMRTEGFGSLRLVTADYHMPRSLIEFRRAMPGVTIVPTPVFPQQVRRDEWWRSEGTARLLIGEYHKFIVALLRGLVPSAAARS